MEKQNIYELQEEIGELQGLNHKVAALGDFFVTMDLSDYPDIDNGFFINTGEVLARASRDTLKFFDQVEVLAMVDKKWLKGVQAKAEHYDALVEAGKIKKEDTYEYKVEMDGVRAYRGTAQALEAEAAKRETNVIGEGVS